MFAGKATTAGVQRGSFDYPADGLPVLERLGRPIAELFAQHQIVARGGYALSLSSFELVARQEPLTRRRKLLLMGVFLVYSILALVFYATTRSPDLPPPGSDDPPRSIVPGALPADRFEGRRPVPVTGIVNAHEHILNRHQLPKLFLAMKLVGVTKTVALGSPRYTYDLGSAGFTDYDENNEEVLAMARMYPGRIVPFVVIHPDDADAPKKLVQYLDKGAKGVKLFTGHGAKDGQGVPFHTMPLDDPRLEAIYRIVEERRIPLMFHVNYGRFQEEFERVLSRHRRMKVVCPHFCLTLTHHDRLRRLLENFPNLWTDVSLGHVTFQAEGYVRIDQAPGALRALIEDFPDRFLFGTDLVITGAHEKSIEWISTNAATYRDLLEKPSYTFFALTGPPLRGLSLPPNLLRRIYKQNAEEWLYSSPKPLRSGASVRDGT